ncbi:hypothetical protein DV515_00015368 [Chloebia gouldiae]|uniref:Uncharacterized protein n=1 Tax=Chloebia gouldiae TaxID=44316 RepID=A0A3L8RVD9_CHLGU|nr:hypothetical protein DV515_00015368 [Chloebia gouldiae]
MQLAKARLQHLRSVNFLSINCAGIGRSYRKKIHEDHITAKIPRSRQDFMGEKRQRSFIMMVMEKPVVRRHLRSGAGEVAGDLWYIKVKERKSFQ